MINNVIICDYVGLFEVKDVRWCQEEEEEEAEDSSCADVF